MNTPTRRQNAEEARTLKITLEGSVDEVERMLQRLAGAPPGDVRLSAEPEPLLLTREQAAKRTGVGAARLSGLIKTGHLTNHGGPGKILLSLAEIRAVVERTGR